MIKNYYKILEVSRYASDEVIKASYRAMAKNFTPTAITAIKHTPRERWRR